MIAPPHDGADNVQTIRGSRPAGARLGCGRFGQAADPYDGSTINLDQILVTDGLTPVEQEKSGRAFTVLTGQQLQQNQVRYVADALRLVPGFSVSRSGSYGGLTQVRVRGAEANHLLVMVDGVDASETSSGEFDFGSLIVDDIERIEVMRGAQSTFWGANALAGVVNIITKRGMRDGVQGGVRSELGTDGTVLAAAGVRGGGTNYDVALSGAFRQSDGYNISDFGSEKDGDRNATVNGNFNLFNGFTATATYTYVDASEQTVADGPRLAEVRRPKHSGPLIAAYVFYEDRARVFGELVYDGKAEDFAFVPSLPPRVTLGSYTLVNVGGSFKFNENLEAFGRVENLFDEEYEEVFGYNTPGRSAFVGLKRTF
ncbi:MAG: TonB-dependent receptor [Rhizobiaceae bacterium]|nr:TonB-dependent receptor [Rhizobiaceae bacterium]